PSQPAPPPDVPSPAPQPPQPEPTPVPPPIPPADQPKPPTPQPPTPQPVPPEPPPVAPPVQRVPPGNPTPSNPPGATVIYSGCVEAGPTPGTYVLATASSMLEPSSATGATAGRNTTPSKTVNPTPENRYALSGAVNGFDLSTHLN